MTNKEAAIGYHKQGYSVMPLRPQTKIPLLPNWVSLQTIRASLDQVEKWWTDTPEANIAILTGHLSGVSVVDFDTKGIKLSLPPTAIVSTPHGWHFYYNHVEGITNRAGLVPGVDIRGEGGYVVAPPSVVTCTKEPHCEETEYTWQTDVDLQPFPLDLFGISPVKQKADFAEILQGAPEGKRNEIATIVIGKLISMLPRASWGSTAWSMFLGWNTLNRPPLPESEMRTIFNSITSRELRKVKEENDDEMVRLSDLVKTLSPEGIKYSTGYKELDDNIRGGLKDGDLVLITGKTGDGKTFFSQNLTYNLISEKIPCAWFSFEVIYEELWRKFKEMGCEDECQIFVPKKNANSTVDWLKAKILEAKDKFNAKVMFIDHLGFITGITAYDKNLSSNYAMFLTLITRAIKQITIKEELVTVLMVHSTKGESSIDSIAYSAGIAQEADHVWVIQRREGFESLLKVEKNRPTGIRCKIKLDLDQGRLIEANKLFSKGLGVIEKPTHKTLDFEEHRFKI